MKKLLLITLLSLVTYFAQSQIAFVNPAAVGANDGTSWANAYTNLQTALTTTSSGSIWVVAGTYYPGTSGTNAATFTLKNNVQILGGFVGTEGGPTQRDPFLNVTILSGDLDQSGTLNANDAYHVVTTANTNSTAILDGFTITGGNANAGGAANSGGGILCAPSAGGGLFDPQFLNCTIMGNRAIQDGGGVVINSVVQASVTVGPKFYNCKFFNNQATSAGGAISSFIFSSNTSTQIENCIFYDNTAGTNGNDIYITAQSTSGVNANITGCTFATNGANNEIVFNPDGGMSGNGLDINNSIWYGLQISSVVFCDGNNNCGDASLITGSGNINVDPMYVNPGADDYHLQCPSPCINTGSNTYVNVATGIDGGPRTQQTTVDIGAFESNYTFPIVAANVSPSVTICNGDAVSLFGSGANSYVWSGGVTDGTPFNPTITDTYTVTGTDVNGCAATKTITITVNPLPIIIANSDVPGVCVGAPVTLTGSGGVGYAWTHSVSDGIPFSPGSTETYTVTGIDANGCQAINMVTVVVEDYFGFTAGVDQDVCRTGTPFITLSGVGNGIPVSWGTMGSGSFTTPNSDGTDYYLSVGDVSLDTIKLFFDMAPIYCAAASDTLLIIMKTPVTINAGPDQDACSDQSTGIQLNGSGSDYSNAQWNSSNFGIPLTQASFTSLYDASPQEVAAGYAEIYLTANPFSIACPQVIDTMYITFHAPPTFGLGVDYTICETDSIALQATISNGTPPFVYSWGNGAPISTANNEMYMPVATENIDLYVSDIYGCSGKDTVLVTVDASETLSGIMHVGAGVLTDGTLYMMKFLPQQTAFDTVSVVPFSAGAGTFTFNNFPHGDYLIKVVPDSLLFPNLIPTYYGDAFQWDSAVVIHHNCASGFNADINMIQLLGGTGSGTVSGYIKEGAGFGTRIINDPDHIFAPGGPLKGVDVKLGKNPGGGIQARTSSDTAGHYEFTNLPDDTYRIYVDIPGLPMDSFYIVTVTADSTINQNYYADSNSVFPVLPTAVSIHEYANSVSSSVNLYPNPASNYTSVIFESDKESIASIRVIAITGKQLMNIQLRNLPRGKHEYQLNFTDHQLQSGIYFVEVLCDGKKEVKKLIVE